MEPLVTADVLRRMVHERIQAHQRGELSASELRGYVIAMYHAGALSLDECQEFLKDGQAFNLTPPASETGESK